jgi:hypothetical protein
LTDCTRRPDAWGTEFGAAVFSEINVRLLAVGEGTLIPISVRGLEHSDVSFLREAVVETLRKHRPRLLFVAVHLSDPDLRENLELALERRGEWLICRDPAGTNVLGKRLTQEHMSTLEHVWTTGCTVSSELTSKSLKLSTASSRLTWLWRAGLVERVEGASSKGGREHRYFAIQ